MTQENIRITKELKDKKEAEEVAKETTIPTEGSQEEVDSMDLADANINKHLNDMNTGA